MSFQIAVFVAILASLALERGEVRLPHLASTTMMRASPGSGDILGFLWHQLQTVFLTGHRRLLLLVFLGLLISIVLGITQIISILLINDINLRLVPGPSSVTDWAVGYTSVGSVIDHEGTWIPPPQVYSTFAEYSEPPYVADGVVDTGKTLRAFLPFAVQQQRESISSFTGYATVLDARVTCQVPSFKNFLFHRGPSAGDAYMVVTGLVTNSTNTPRLSNLTKSVENYTDWTDSLSSSYEPFSYNLPTAFGCGVD